MNTENMNNFLDQISKNYPDKFNLIILDKASSHKSKALQVPENIQLIHLPPYSPELNPVEQLWNVLRRNGFANKVFDSIEAVIKQVERLLTDMAKNKSAIISLTNWEWISCILNA